MGIMMALLVGFLAAHIANRITPLERVLAEREMSDLAVIAAARSGEINHWQLLKDLGIPWSGPQPNRVFRMYSDCDACVGACGGHWV